VKILLMTKHLTLGRIVSGEVKDKCSSKGGNARNFIPSA